MSFFPFLVYPIKSILKNRRRSLYAIIGILIAVSFISSSFILVDTSAYSLLKDALDSVPIDFNGSGTERIAQINESELNNVASDFESFDNVIDVEPFAYSITWTPLIFYEDLDMAIYQWKFIFLPENSTRILESYKISGNSPVNGTVAVSKSTANNLGLEVGDKIDISWEKWNISNNNTESFKRTYLNLSFQISDIWTQNVSELTTTDCSNCRDNSSIQILIDNPIIFNMRDAHLILDPLQEFSEGEMKIGLAHIEYFIWVDRDEIINIGNRDGTFERLWFVKTRLENRASQLGLQNWGISTWPLDAILSDFYSELGARKIIYFGLSLPVLALGTYLSIIGIEQGTRERRLEIGILKSRGATNKQLFSLMITESLILGAVAGLIGLLIGFTISIFMFGFSAPFLNTSVGLNFEYPVMNLITIIAAIVLGISLMILSTYRPLKRAINMDVSETLHYSVSGETMSEYKMRWDILSLFLVILSAASVMILNQEMIYESIKSYFFQMFLVALWGVGLAILTVVPLLLSLSGVRLLTRIVRKPYTELTRIIKPWTKELHYIVKEMLRETLSEFPGLCIIIALTLALALFISITMESSIAYTLNQAEYEPGADIKVEAYRVFEIDSPIKPDVESLAGINNLCWFYSINSYIIAFNATSYSEVVKPADFWFLDAGSEKLMELKRNGTVLLSEQRADHLRIGDIVTEEIHFYDKINGTNLYTIPLNLEVIGFVKSLPGLSYQRDFPIKYENYLFINQETLSFILNNKQLMRDISGSHIGVLVSVEENTNHELVANNLEILFTDVGLDPDIKVMEVELENIQKDPFFIDLKTFLNSEYFISIIIMGTGIALIMFANVHDRKQELACIIARGASRSQIRRILIGESISIMILGMLIGISVGFLTAYLFNAMTIQTLEQFGRTIIVTHISLLLIVVLIISLFLSSFLAAIHAGRTKLIEILRIRGG